MALKPHLHQWIPAPKRRDYLVLLEIGAGLRRPAMRSVVFKEDSGATESV